MGRALVNRAGRKPVRAGCSALGNMPSWNTDLFRSFRLASSIETIYLVLNLVVLFTMGLKSNAKQISSSNQAFRRKTRRTAHALSNNVERATSFPT